MLLVFLPVLLALGVGLYVRGINCNSTRWCGLLDHSLGRLGGTVTVDVELVDVIAKNLPSDPFRTNDC